MRHSTFVRRAIVAFLFAAQTCARPHAADAGPAHVVICYLGSGAFVIASPPGWSNAAATARRFGLCGMYLPGETTFDDAAAVIYPRVAPRLGGDTGEEAAKLLAEDSRQRLQSVWEDDGPAIEAAGHLETVSGEPVFLWRFNQGPPPNEWEAVAYFPKNDVVLMLVLSARDQESREKYLPDLEAMARQVVPLLKTGPDETQ